MHSHPTPANANMALWLLPLSHLYLHHSWYLFWMVVLPWMPSHYYQLDKHTSLILPTLVDLVPGGKHKQLLGGLRILRILQISRGGLSW